MGKYLILVNDRLEGPVDHKTVESPEEAEDWRRFFEATLLGARVEVIEMS